MTVKLFLKMNVCAFTREVDIQMTPLFEKSRVGSSHLFQGCHSVHNVPGTAYSISLNIKFSPLSKIQSLYFALISAYLWEGNVFTLGLLGVFL